MSVGLSSLPRTQLARRQSWSMLRLQEGIAVRITLLFPLALSAVAAPAADALALSGDTFTVSFSAANGSILAVSQKNKPGAICRGGEHGLWRIRFQDGSTLNAADFSADSVGQAFQLAQPDQPGTLRFSYRSPDVIVAVTVTARDSALSFAASVTPQKKTVLDLSLPARLRADSAQLQRFVCPMNGNFSVGTAFTPEFFKEQPLDHPSAWRPVSPAAGPAGYRALYGDTLDQRPDRDPPVALRVTDEGRAFLGDALALALGAAKAVVNRPPKRTQADVVLVDSANGPYLSAKRLDRGQLWRIGGGVGETEKTLAADMVAAVAARVAAGTVERRGSIGLLALEHGPDWGGWASVTVKEWRDRLSRLPAVGKVVTFSELKTPSDLERALAADSFTFILNPYGEWMPALPGKDMAATVAAIARYVRAGGNWFETGGYPFFYELRPARFLNYAISYPPAFADFLHLETAAGAGALYGVQPRKWPPWEGAKNKAAIFVPGRLGCGCDEQGAYFERAFGTFVTAGQTWDAPQVRLAVGRAAFEELDAYCQANQIARRLEDKVKPDVLRKLKESVLVYYAGNAKEKTDNLNLLPVPTLIHFADYLHGGFDKQYPDHLPPHPGFGTPEELRAFFNRAHELGHLVEPYTNPTWWCDHPKGPTFEREGDAPLLMGLDGKPVYERYEANDGWTVCHWHPAVQAANREAVRQFTQDFPVDVLFQDQNGARGWSYDTNPASPTPYAYTDGLISQVAEDCQRVPLGTEAGWDGVVNDETQLCGLSFQILPTEHGPAWLRLMKHEYPPATWNIFPVAQRIAHDKTFMLHHDLGQFVTNRGTLAWTLGLGFSLSYRVSAAGLAQDAPREWLKWLDRLQKSVCARYIGQPVTAFVHDRGPTPAAEDDGVIRAGYGPVNLVANLSPTSRKEDGCQLPPYGFRATAPGLIAANLREVAGKDFGDDGVSFVVESDGKKADIWVYASAEQEVAVELPPVIRADHIVESVGDLAPVAGPVREGALTLRTGARAGKKRLVPPPELAGRAPRDWPGAKPAIGVLDLGAGFSPAWTRIGAEQWFDAFAQSRLAKEHQVPARRIATTDDLIAALKAGPTAWLAIINPYGEHFPATAPGKWREMLELIRQYVNNGGSWWETGGYSLYGALSSKDGAWEREPVGPSGLGSLGIPVGGGAVDQAPEPLRVSPEGRAWLRRPALSSQVEKAFSAVNRALPRSHDDPGHVTLVAGADEDFIGGYRLGGWGWFWRIGGMNPNPEVALPVAVAATEFLYTNPPLPVKPGGIKYLWHATVVTPEGK